MLRDTLFSFSRFFGTKVPQKADGRLSFLPFPVVKRPFRTMEYVFRILDFPFQTTESRFRPSRPVKGSQICKWEEAERPDSSPCFLPCSGGDEK